jgi:hypothetical protein
VEADGGRRSAEVVSAVGIVPVPLDLLRWNGNVVPVLSSLRVDIAVKIHDLSWIAVRVIATTGGRVIGHAPCRIELFVQELILRRMVVLCSLILSSFLCLNWYRQSEANTAAQEEFAEIVHVRPPLSKVRTVKNVFA